MSKPTTQTRVRRLPIEERIRNHGAVLAMFQKQQDEATEAISRRALRAAIAKIEGTIRGLDEARARVLMLQDDIQVKKAEAEELMDCWTERVLAGDPGDEIAAHEERISKARDARVAVDTYREIGFMIDGLLGGEPEMLDNGMEASTNQLAGDDWIDPGLPLRKLGPEHEEIQ